jgi:hypothetical protein
MKTAPHARGAAGSIERSKDRALNSCRAPDKQHPRNRRRCACRSCVTASLLAAMRRIYADQARLGHEIVWITLIDLISAPADQPMCLGGRRFARVMSELVDHPLLETARRRIDYRRVLDECAGRRA